MVLDPHPQSRDTPKVTVMVKPVSCNASGSFFIKDMIARIMLFRHYVIASLVLLRNDLNREELELYLKIEKYLKQADFYEYSLCQT